VYSQPPAPAERKKHGPLYWIVVVIAIIVLIVIVVVVATFVFAVATTATITAINITSADDACGVNGQTLPGFVASGGSAQETFVVNGGIFLSCTISSVSATTSGFSISGANTPLTVPADGSESLSFTVHTPNSYNGVLTIDIE